MTTKRLINRIATGIMYIIALSAFIVVAGGMILLVVMEAKKGIYFPLYIIGTAILFCASFVIVALTDERTGK